MFAQFSFHNRQINVGENKNTNLEKIIENKNDILSSVNRRLLIVSLDFKFWLVVWLVGWLALFFRSLSTDCENYGCAHYAPYPTIQAVIVQPRIKNTALDCLLSNARRCSQWLI